MLFGRLAGFPKTLGESPATAVARHLYVRLHAEEKSAAIPGQVLGGARFSGRFEHSELLGEGVGEVLRREAQPCQVELDRLGPRFPIDEQRGAREEGLTQRIGAGRRSDDRPQPGDGEALGV